MDVTIKFLGAAHSVTGSKYLLDIDGFRLLFDCGLFQGLKELRLRNWDEFPTDPNSIDAVVISHAHIDHTGYLPKLVKEGYGGPIYCTPPTADLMEIMLLDSAKLQMEEAEYARKKGYSKHENPQPLYTEEDAKRCFSLFRTIPYDLPTRLNDRIEIIYRDAGHLLGSAITEMMIKGDSSEKKITFSGDIGRYRQAMMKPPTEISHTDILIVESTYGNADNPEQDPEKELEKIANETFGRGGILVIPAFAVGRTQGLLHYLRKLMKEDRIDDVPVYVDSPMAISATYLFYKYPAYHTLSTDSRELAHDVETNMLVFVKSAAHSKTLNTLRKPAVIISSSGMMTGGRILHHLFHRLSNPQDTILIAGYQAEGTRGRNLLEGAETIRIFGQDIPVRAQIAYTSAMSGHADKGELFQWLDGFDKKPKMTFCTHGEGENLMAYAENIRKTKGWNVHVPAYLESFALFSGI